MRPVALWLDFFFSGQMIVTSAREALKRGLDSEGGGFHVVFGSVFGPGGLVELVEGCGVCVDNDAVVFQDSTLSDAFQKK